MLDASIIEVAGRDSEVRMCHVPSGTKPGSCVAAFRGVWVQMVGSSHQLLVMLLFVPNLEFHPRKACGSRSKRRRKMVKMRFVRNPQSWQG